MDFTKTGIAMALAVGLSLVTACDRDEAKEKVPAVDTVSGGLSVMVLGSGGPVATPKGRASAGYLIFVEGEPRILMDAGGGTYQRLAQSGTNIRNLDIVLLSHLHADHASDVSSIIKTLYFHNSGAGSFREAPIRFYGPAANGKTFPNSDVSQYPSTSNYLDGHYAMPNGVERYLNIFSKAIKGGVFGYEANDVDSDLQAGVQTLLDSDGLKVEAISVIHGPVPALAYRIEYKGKSIVYSGDTSSKTDNMIKLAGDADLLIYDTAIMDNKPDNKIFYKLHTTPSRIGEVARDAKVKSLLLSHITPVTDPNMDDVKKLIRDKGYAGDLEAASDLMVINLDK